MSDELKPCAHCGGVGETEVIGPTVDSGEADSREKLEADVRGICWGYDFYRYDAQKRYLDERGLDVREDIVTTNYDGHVLATVIMHLLNRQAAITRREFDGECEFCRSEVARLQSHVDNLEEEAEFYKRTANRLHNEVEYLEGQLAELTAERDELRDKLREKQHVCDVQRDSFLKLERECRELQDVCGELERTVENLRGD